MNRDFRVPVADGYVSALGRAAYNFSYLESGVVWLAETLRPGFLGGVAGMTAGMIARAFGALSDTCADGDADDLRKLASSFVSLVKDRNALLHGVPYKAARGEPRLLHIGPNGRRDWTETLILEAAERFETAGIEANRLLHAGRYEAYLAATGTTLSI